MKFFGYAKEHHCRYIWRKEQPKNARTLTTGHTPAWQTLGWLIKQHPNHFLPLPLLQRLGQLPTHYPPLTVRGGQVTYLWPMQWKQKSAKIRGRCCLGKPFLFWLRVKYSKYCPSPCLSSFLCFQCRCDRGCHSGHLKTRADLQEGKAKTLTEILALTLLRQKPMLGTAYLWTSFYRRKINPSCLSCRSWVFSHLQLNTLLTEDQPKRNSKTEGCTLMHIPGVVEP